MKIVIRLFGVVVLLVLVSAIVGGLTVVSMGESAPTGAPPEFSLVADSHGRAQ